MARKQTYIYGVQSGNNGVGKEFDVVYARNAERAKLLCKNKYADKKYDWYKAVKRGISKTLREDGFVSNKDKETLMNAQPEADAYAERIPAEAGTSIPVEASVE